MSDSRAAASGIYGLFRLDGGPVDRKDAEALGIDPFEPAACIASGIDTPGLEAVHRREDDSGLTILVGHIEEPNALAAVLKLAPATPPALLARAALARFGSEMPSTVIGEWSLFHGESPGRVTLMQSAARRDRIFYAICGPRVAVAPDLFQLAKLPWVGTALDQTGLLFGLASGELRGAMGERTMIANVRQLEPACSVTFSKDGIRKGKSDPFTVQAPWRGSFEDAMTEADHVMRTIVRARLARTPAAAVMLSGGLDSSLLACLAAEERAESQPIFLFTSVAPPGSGLADEAKSADAVASLLGLEAEHLWPPAAADIFRPPDFILAGASGPPLPTRHCLTETFQRAGLARGATVLIDGTWGELTLSAQAQEPLKPRFRAAARLLRQAFAGRSHGPGRKLFHVRLSARLRANLPAPFRAYLGAKSPARAAPGPGYAPGAVKAMRHANQFYGGAIRAEFPYRDLRLLRLFASFPASFINHGGLSRAPARHLLKNRVPDAIRLRADGRPASPDHLERMRRQAPAARTRIDEFRKAGVDEWLDLGWLDSALGRISAQGPRDYADANEIQLTAITAEFLTWWRLRR